MANARRCSAQQRRWRVKSPPNVPRKLPVLSFVVRPARASLSVTPLHLLRRRRRRNTNETTTTRYPSSSPSSRALARNRLRRLDKPLSREHATSRACPVRISAIIVGATRNLPYETLVVNSRTELRSSRRSGSFRNLVVYLLPRWLY